MQRSRARKWRTASERSRGIERRSTNDFSESGWCAAPEIEFTNRIRRLRNKGYVARLHLALSELPAFQGLDSPEGRLIIAPTMDSMEFAWDAAKYGELPRHP